MRYKVKVKISGVVYKGSVIADSYKELLELTELGVEAKFKDFEMFIYKKELA